MNERIEALIKRCTDFEYSSGTNYLDKELFAELIVKECMDCAVWVGKMNTSEVLPANTAHAINIRIAKHFGIKE